MKDTNARKPVNCYCCKKPLTYSRKLDPARLAEVESWDCTDPDCIIYRQRRPGIPDPPKSK
jgi:hypothetical protein